MILRPLKKINRFAARNVRFDYFRIKQMKISIGGPSFMPLLVIMTKLELTWRKDMTRSW